MKRIVFKFLSFVALRAAIGSLSRCSALGGYQAELKDKLKNQMELLKGETGGKV